MKVNNAAQNVSVLQTNPRTSGETNSLVENIASIHNNASVSLQALKFDENADLDFSQFEFNKMKSLRQKPSPTLTRKYLAYPYKTLGSYREAKNYPCGRDIRPAHFDPEGPYVAAHGTNFDTLLRAAINCNLQIVPGLKVFKLQGKQSETGEHTRFGISHLNCTHVSTVSILCMTSDFHDVKAYAKGAASGLLKGSQNLLNSMPVVIIGDGIAKMSVHSAVSNEVGYKRLNIRIVAFKNEEDKKTGMEWLKKTRDEFGLAALNSVKFCTFDDLDKTKEERDSVPNINALWEKSEPLDEVTRL